MGAVKLGTEFKSNEDGALEINEININKLVQDEGDTLVLDGGLSSGLK
jgi:hypothetical protein